MSDSRKISYGLMSLGALICVISAFNIPVTNIVALVVGAIIGFVGYKIHQKEL